MPLTTIGKGVLASLTLQEGAIPFTPTTSMLGVGDSNQAFNVAQTDLLGTNTLRLPMDDGYPKIDPSDDSVMIFRARFNELFANFSWQEWGVFNSGPLDTGGSMLVRVVEDIGVKLSGSIWVFTAYIKFQ